jgi:hypothetical protein
MPIPKTQTFELSEPIDGPTKAKALTISEAGTVAVSGANNAALGNFQVTGASAGSYSVKCTPPGGAPINVKFTLSKGAGGSFSATGIYGALPFSLELSSAGQLLSGSFPKLPAPETGFFKSIGGFKLDKLLPIKPTPTHPEPEEKMVAGGPAKGGPVITPAFNGRCAGAVVLFVIAAAASEGFSALAGAAWLTGECHNWSF